MRETQRISRPTVETTLYRYCETSPHQQPASFAEGSFRRPFPRPVRIPSDRFIGLSGRSTGSLLDICLRPKYIVEADFIPNQFRIFTSYVVNGAVTVNNGLTDLDYSFGDDEELNLRLSLLINEFCHVFRYHADGHWKKTYKPKYAAQLCDEISRTPSLIRKLLSLKDPAVSNVTHAAIELRDLIAAENNNNNNSTLIVPSRTN